MRSRRATDRQHALRDPASRRDDAPAVASVTAPGHDQGVHFVQQGHGEVYHPAPSKGKDPITLKSSVTEDKAVASKPV